MPIHCKKKVQRAGPPQPVEEKPFVADARGEEDSTFKDVGTRRDEQGVVRTESPRRDFIHATSQELGSEGVPWRNPKQDTDILRDMLTQPVIVPPPETTNAEPMTKPVVVPASRVIRMTTLNQWNENSRKEKVTVDLPKAPEKNESDFHWLRRRLGFTPRQITKLMSNKAFNAPVVSTDFNALSEPKFAKRLEKIRAKESTWMPDTYHRHLGELMNSLPMKSQTAFSSTQIKFYKAYAAGNYTADELAERYGSMLVSTVILIENDIIRHLGAIGLLKIRRQYSREFSIEEDWQMENQAIAAGGLQGGTVIGSKYKFGFGRYALDSFETGTTKFVRARGDYQSGDGPAYDDNQDDSEGHAPD